MHINDSEILTPENREFKFRQVAGHFVIDKRSSILKALHQGFNFGGMGAVSSSVPHRIAVVIDIRSRIQVLGPHLDHMDQKEREEAFRGQ